MSHPYVLVPVRIDVLVHNAAVQHQPETGADSENPAVQAEHEIGTNLVAPVAQTLRLLPVLRDS